jgi:hypothetical protein
MLVIALLLVGCTLLPSPREFPAEVDGNRVLTVAEALAARDSGVTGRIAVGGWFSMAPMHSCPAPFGEDGVFREPNPLEIYCHEGDWILAEKPEAVVDVTIVSTGDSTSMTVGGREITGPWLQPVLEIGEGQIFPPGTTEQWRPVPVVLVGHFGDPRAATCLEELRVACADRFVADSVGWPP